MPAQSSTTLPRLDSDELITFFGNDNVARRRYEALSAILHHGKTQREAAAAAHMSERTVRNILKSFNRRGVNGLRSTQNGTRRRTNARKQFEQALRSALRAEPEAGGDRLWHRAQELLGSEGAQLSRRTAYRILAALRAAEEEGDQEADELLGKLRTALPQLHEDPPLALGGSALAQHLLPNDGDALARGLLLQQALCTAIDRLRPDGPVSTVDRGWWPYLICSGEYEAGQRRAELQLSLSLSPSTYSRAKRQGLTRILALLPALIAQANVRSVPQRLPRVADFVGRAEQQAFYSSQLISNGLTQIWGIAASGKTALAAEIAAEGRRYGQRVIWHSCSSVADATLTGIVRGLARGLASSGDETLVEAVDDMRPEDDHATLLVLLSQLLLRQPTLIVIDDVQRCFADPTVMPLMDELRALANRRAVRLLLIGRERLPWITCAPLDGLPPSEAWALWESIGGPPLQPDRRDQVVQATAGLPGLLPLVAHYADEYGLRGSWHDELENWSRVELLDRLDDDDQRVLALLAADSRPLPPDDETLLAALDVTPARLTTLEDRGVLLRVPQGLVPHPILQLGTSPLSMPHWEQFQAARSAAELPVDGVVESPTEYTWPSVEIVPLSDDVVVPVELLTRLTETVEQLDDRAQAEANLLRLRMLAEQLRMYLPQADRERAYNG